jgi:hypothetical protein
VVGWEGPGTPFAPWVRIPRVLLTGPAVANTGLSSILLAVEQRKDLKIQPVQVASTDPAFISGLMSSGRDEPEEPGSDVPGQTEHDGAAESASAGNTAEDADAPDASSDDAPQAAAEAGTAEGSADAATAEADADADVDTDADADATAEAAPDSDKPSFEASDRRGSVTIDARGAQLTLDDQAAEWTWEEIAAIEYDTSRFGRRLTVTVHTPERRWYPGEVQAPDKATLQEWTAQLDDVLDAYFEDEEEAASDDGASTDAEASDEATAEVADAADEPSPEAATDAEAEAEAATEKPEAEAKPETKAKSTAKAKAKAESAAKD